MSELEPTSLERYFNEHSGVLVDIILGVDFLAERPSLIVSQSADGSFTANGSMPELEQLARHDIGSFALRSTQVIRTDGLRTSSHAIFKTVADPAFRDIVANLTFSNAELLDAMSVAPPKLTGATWETTTIHTTHTTVTASKTSLTYNNRPAAIEYSSQLVTDEKRELLELGFVTGRLISLGYSNAWDNSALLVNIVKRLEKPDPKSIVRLVNLANGLFTQTADLDLLDQLELSLANDELGLDAIRALRTRAIQAKMTRSTAIHASYPDTIALQHIANTLADARSDAWRR